MLCQVTWSADGSKIYANCQENSAIVTIDVATATATSIHAMPLKDWSAAGGTEGIDTEKDDACESMQRALLISLGGAAILGLPCDLLRGELLAWGSSLYAPEDLQSSLPSRGCVCGAALRVGQARF